MSDRQDGPRLYKARGPDGEVTWVDHEGLWRLQQSQAERLRRDRLRRRRWGLLALAVLVALALALVPAVGWLRSPAPPASRMSDAPPAAVTSGPGTGAGAAAVEPTGSDETGSHETGAGETVADETGADESGVDEIAAEPAAGRPEVEAGQEGGEPPASAAGPPVAEVVGAWAAAWARRDVPAYLASYSSEFAPADGAARAEWERLRRRRLLEPEWIRVEIERLELSLPGDGRAEVRFVQRYRSPGYSDDVLKVLELVEEAGSWRIVSERAAPL